MRNFHFLQKMNWKIEQNESTMLEKVNLSSPHQLTPRLTGLIWNCYGHKFKLNDYLIPEQQGEPGRISTDRDQSSHALMGSRLGSRQR